MRKVLLVPALPLVAIAVVAATAPAGSGSPPSLVSVAHADRGSHGAYYPVEPAVYPRRVACTTEPAPRAPILKQRPSPRARLRVRVTGQGSLCRARWTAARAAPGSTELTLTATAGADAPSACGTCVVDLLITRLGRGDYRVTFDGTTLRAHAP